MTVEMRSEPGTLTEILLGGTAHGSRECFTLIAADENRAVASITFEDLVDHGLRAASALRSIGVEPGERVMIVAEPSVDWVVAFFGIVLSGAVAVPVNFRFQAREIGIAAGVVDPVVVLCDDGTERRVHDGIQDDHSVRGLAEVTQTAVSPLEPVLPQPDDLAVILFTSGTTGIPKGVERTQADYAYFLRVWGRHVMEAEDRILNFLPLNHQAGLVCGFLAPFSLGAPVFHVDRFDRRTFWETVDANRLTWAVMMQPVPRYLLEMPARPDDRDHTLAWIQGSIALEDWNKFQQRFDISMNSGYGSTETTIVTMTGGRRSGLVDASRIHGAHGGILCGGRFEPGSTVRVVDEAGDPCDADVPGAIEVTGPAVFERYFGTPEVTASTFTEDGWFKTGDVGYFSPSGDLYMLERQSAMIRRSGENIAPREIEDVLEMHPAVVEAAVVGIRDKVRGEEVAAFVVVRDSMPVTPEDLFEHCGSHLIGFKVPRYLELRDSLPRNATFKVRRDELKLSAAAIDRSVR